MKYIPRDLAFAKLKALAEGAAIVRRELRGAQPPRGPQHSVGLLSRKREPARPIGSGTRSSKAASRSSSSANVSRMRSAFPEPEVGTAAARRQSAAFLRSSRTCATMLSPFASGPTLAHSGLDCNAAPLQRSSALGILQAEHLRLIVVSEDLRVAAPTDHSIERFLCGGVA